MRLLLAAVVAVQHTQIIAASGAASRAASWLDARAAVFCFFILSGWSIAASLDRDSNARAFYGRRVDRLWPTLAVLTGIGLLPWIISGGAVAGGGRTLLPPPDLKEFLAIALLVPPLWGWKPQILGGPLWSLVCEVIYYAAAPLLWRLRDGQIIVLCAASALLDLRLGAGPDTPLLGGVSAMALFWWWGCGFLWYRNRSKPIGAALLWATAFGLEALRPIQLDRGAAMLFIATILALTSGQSLRLARVATTIGTGCGDLSYPLYATHIAIFFILATIGEVRVAPLLIGALGFASLVTWGIDRPYQRRCHAARRSRGHHGGTLQRAPSSISPVPGD